VAVAARHDAQKAAAEKLGARLDPQGEYDIVIECAGNSKALAQAARLCRPRGKLLLLATYWEGVQLPAFEVSMKNLTIEASSMYSQSGAARDIDVAAQLLGRYPQVADALISHRMPLDAAVEAFAVARDRKAGAIKVVLEP
jgi:threonine dehydrogenase-like Zn-dependent dehydrogenase